MQHLTESLKRPWKTMMVVVLTVVDFPVGLLWLTAATLQTHRLIESLQPLGEQIFFPLCYKRGTCDPTAKRWWSQDYNSGPSDHKGKNLLPLSECRSFHSCNEHRRLRSFFFYIYLPTIFYMSGTT